MVECGDSCLMLIRVSKVVLIIVRYMFRLNIRVEVILNFLIIGQVM